MKATLLRLRRLCPALLPVLVLPAGAAAQFAGTGNLHTGSMNWDQPDGRDALLDGKVEATYLLRSSSWLRPQLVGGFGVMTAPAQPPAVHWDVGAQLQTAGNTAVWLGAALGAAGIGNPGRGFTRLEGGIRRTLGPARLNLWLSRTGFGAGVAPGGGLGQDTSDLVDTLARRRGVKEYSDLTSQVSVGSGRAELGLTLTRRIGHDLVRRTGWELSGTWWMSPTIGVVGATGHSLPQLGFVVPGGRFGTMGLRFAFGAGGRSGPKWQKANGSSSIAGPSLSVSNRRLTIRSAPARTAEVMGDFSDWKPLPLRPSGNGRWTLPAQLTPGLHHLNVRFNGGPWLVPAGLPAVDDGFGGRVGLVVVK
jgi:hypothetical protein